MNDYLPLIEAQEKKKRAKKLRTIVYIAVLVTGIIAAGSILIYEAITSISVC